MLSVRAECQWYVNDYTSLMCQWTAAAAAARSYQYYMLYAWAYVSHTLILQILRMCHWLPVALWFSYPRSSKSEPGLHCRQTMT